MTESIADLLLISIAIPPRDVEHLLDALAQFPHPINAGLKYEEWQTTVEFPAYRSWLPAIRAMLESRGFNAARFKYTAAVGDALRTHGAGALPSNDYNPGPRRRA